MSYRVLTLDSGDTLRISESVLRGTGPDGPAGPQGPPGLATTIVGRFGSYDELVAALPVGIEGEAYIADDTGHLWVWVYDIEVPEWRDCGRIVGPPAVSSIGAQRIRQSSADLLGGQWWTVPYQTLTYNDPDPLSGSVLRESALTPTSTVFGAENTGHYLVVTEISVSPGVNDAFIDVEWNDNTKGVTYGQETSDTRRSGSWVLLHACVLRSDGVSSWQIRIRPSINVTVSSVVSTFTRIGGGIGPQGVPGPYPELSVSAPTKLPHDAAMTASFTKTGEGAYTLNLGLAQGAPGEAQSGFSTMDAIAGGEADSSSQPEGYEPVYATDQGIPVPGRNAKPHVPYFFNQMAQKLHRLVVARLTTSQRQTRGTPIPGELVYDTDTKQFLGGDAAGAWMIVPTIEYGTDASIKHNAPTTRPNGSLYFKHEA